MVLAACGLRLGWVAGATGEICWPPSCWGPRWEEAGTRVAMEIQKGSCQGGGGAVFGEGRVRDCNSSQCPGLGGTRIPPDSYSALSSHTCDVRGHRALLSRAQPIPWGHRARSRWRCLEPLRAAPRLRLSPGGGCQGGDLRAHTADSEDILEQMTIMDSTSLP